MKPNKNATLAPNYNIFEESDDYWHRITNSGSKPVPEFVISIILSDGEIIEERKHPVYFLGEGRWMTNYSEVL